MKRILVTGGAGFVGAHLCTKLISQGHKVFCIDDFSTGTMDNILDLIQNPNFVWLKHDITIPLISTQWEKIDEIYNLACPASPIHYQQDPVKTIKTSVLGSINMLELAKKIGAKILQTSTSEVYGDPKVHPQPETYWGNVNPIGLRSCYDEGKRCAETLFMDYHRQYKIPIRIIRIFNTYGPKMQINDGRVISNFIGQALQNKDITVFGCGTQTRSFQFISDLINGMIKVMEMDYFIGPINIGNPIEFSIIKLTEIILRHTGSTSQLRYDPLPSDDPKQRKPDINLAIEYLDWYPKIELEEGLLTTIKYFKTLLK